LEILPAQTIFKLLQFGRESKVTLPM